MNGGKKHMKYYKYYKSIHITPVTSAVLYRVFHTHN